MAITAYTGPIVSFGSAVQQSTGNTLPADYNTQAAPSFAYLGWGVLDQRGYYSYKPGGGLSSPLYGWAPSGAIPVIDAVPGTISSMAISTSQAATAGTALTLLTASTLAVTINQSVVNPITGATVTGLLAIDTVMTPLTFGSDANINVWDPLNAISRCINITSIASSSLPDDSGMYWSVKGYDVYGYPMTERIAGSSATSSIAVAVTSRKAFKYIEQIIPTNSTGVLNSTTVMAGVTDTYGLPLYAAQTPYYQAYMGGVLLSSISTFTAGSTTTATSTTADVRGTFASSIASDNSVRLIVFQTLRPANIAADTTAGVTGVTQYSSE